MNTRQRGLVLGIALVCIVVALAIATMAMRERGVKVDRHVMSPIAADSAEMKSIAGGEGLEFFSKFVFTTLVGKPEMAVEPQKEFLILGAGLSRTGTKSTKAALTLLGYKVLHCEDVFGAGLWNKYIPHAYYSDIMLNRFIDEALAMGYNATVDFPNNGLVFRMAKRFPNAKILYTERDTPEQWEKSYRVLTGMGHWLLHKPFSFFMDYSPILPGGYDLFFGLDYEHDACDPDEHPYLQMLPWFDCKSGKKLIIRSPFTEVYKNWEKKVKDAFVSPNRTHTNPFLQFNVKQGWGPLVKFLGIENPPNIPFPKVNEARTLEIIEVATRTICVIYPFIFLAILFGFMWVSEAIMQTLRKGWATLRRKPTKSVS